MVNICPNRRGYIGEPKCSLILDKVLSQLRCFNSSWNLSLLKMKTKPGILNNFLPMITSCGNKCEFNNYKRHLNINPIELNTKGHFSKWKEWYRADTSKADVWDFFLIRSATPTTVIPLSNNACRIKSPIYSLHYSFQSINFRSLKIGRFRFITCFIKCRLRLLIRTTF